MRFVDTNSLNEEILIIIMYASGVLIWMVLCAEIETIVAFANIRDVNIDIDVFNHHTLSMISIASVY